MPNRPSLASTSADGDRRVVGDEQDGAACGTHAGDGFGRAGDGVVGQPDDAVEVTDEGGDVGHAAIVARRVEACRACPASNRLPASATSTSSTSPRSRPRRTTCCPPPIAPTTAACTRANVVHIDVPMPAEGAERYANAARAAGRVAGGRHPGRRPGAQLHALPHDVPATRRAGPAPSRATSAASRCCRWTRSGDVLPHEQTTPKDRSDRLDLTRATDANLSPVWGLSMADGFAELAGLPGVAVGELHGRRGHARPDAHRRPGGVRPHRRGDRRGRRSSSPTGTTATPWPARSGPSGARPSSDAPGGYDLTMALVTALSPEGLFVQAIHRLVSAVPASFDLRAHLATYFELSPAGAVSPATAARRRGTGRALPRGARRPRDVADATGRRRSRACATSTRCASRRRWPTFPTTCATSTASTACSGRCGPPRPSGACCCARCRSPRSAARPRSTCSCRRSRRSSPRSRRPAWSSGPL